MAQLFLHNNWLTNKHQHKVAQTIYYKLYGRLLGNICTAGKPQNKLPAIKNQIARAPPSAPSAPYKRDNWQIALATHFDIAYGQFAYTHAYCLVEPKRRRNARRMHISDACLRFCCCYWFNMCVSHVWKSVSDVQRLLQYE